jgi:hypothetical protein
MQKPSQPTVMSKHKDARKPAVTDRHPRMTREHKTIEAMIRMHCHSLHRTPESLCPDCLELLTYASKRLSRCPYQEGKTPCARCPIHCYKPAMRERIRAVMRYAGPKMIYRHPLLALYHLWPKPTVTLWSGHLRLDGRRKEPSNACDVREKEGISLDRMKE